MIIFARNIKIPGLEKAIQVAVLRVRGVVSAPYNLQRLDLVLLSSSQYPQVRTVIKNGPYLRKDDVFMPVKVPSNMILIRFGKFLFYEARQLITE